METKLAKLKAAAAAGDWAAALAIAARFPRLGDEAAEIKRAHECLNGSGADFYRQLGQCPEALIRNGIDALCRKYRLSNTNGSDPTMTTMTTPQIDELTSIIAGQKLGRSRDKAKTIARLTKACEAAGRDAAALLALDYASAQAALAKPAKAGKSKGATTTPAAKEAPASAAPEGNGAGFSMDPAAFKTGWKYKARVMTQEHKGWLVEAWREADEWLARLTRENVVATGKGETFRKAIKDAASRT